MNTMMFIVTVINVNIPCLPAVKINIIINIPSKLTIIVSRFNPRTPVPMSSTEPFNNTLSPL